MQALCSLSKFVGMVGCQKKTLPLVGLVASLPTAMGFAPTRHGGKRSSAIDVTPSVDAEASRGAFLVASLSTLVGISFACPAEAEVGRFRPKDFFKRNGQVNSSSDSDSDDSDSDSVSSSSSSEGEEATTTTNMKETDGIVPAGDDVPTK
jgi:hypothetical protein